MKVVFQQLSSSRLFVSDNNLSGAGWWAFLVPKDTPLDGKPVPLDTALNSAALSTSFIYSPTAPDFSPKEALDGFIAAIDAILGSLISPRALLFLSSGALADVTKQNATIIELTGSPVTVNKAPPPIPLCTAKSPIQLAIATGSTLSVSPQIDAIVFDGGSSSPSVSLAGLLSQDTYQPENTASLLFDGPAQGAFTYSLAIRRGALKARLNWGFQTLIPNNTPSTIAYLTAWLPLADASGASGADMLGFNFQVNPVNPNNQLQCSSTKFFFTGQNSGSSARTSLASFYRTNAGHPITLYPLADSSNGQQPAALIITNGYLTTHLQNGFSFAPEGDFALTVDGAAANVPVTMLCGMTGTETISVLPYVESQYPGYRLRFFSQRPALTPVFPLLAYSPISAPIDPKALLMNTAFVTSWASVLPPPQESTSAFYAAAPKGADLFGLNSAAAADQTPDLLVPASPGLTLSTTAVFPLIPFAGFTAGLGDQDLTTDQLAQLERQILSPTRRSQISSNSSPAAHAHRSLKLAAGNAPACPYNATTPTGFISRVACDGSFSQLLLAQVMPPGSSTASLQMGFTALKPQLQSAFQTDNMFLVVANAKLLGTPSSGTFMPPGGQTIDDKNLFFNTITIGDWEFRASVGEENRYSDYRNVMIVKGVKGKLIDLVLSPDKWTMKDVFGAPSTPRPDGTVTPDLAQLIPLSAWMSDYFAAALEQKDNPYFQNFCNIIQSDDWTGVLLLRVDIASVPDDLAGILAGVSDPSRFYAHHVGIEISQIDGKTVQQKDGSSLFGLVYYVSTGYDDSATPHPVSPADLSQPYDFALLVLKALFTNSALTRFESLAQIVLNDVFGATVSGMGEGGNLYNAILLEGAVQKHGDTAVYSLASNGTSVYNLANNVLTTTEIDSAVMSTRDDGSTSGQVVSWIAMSGFMDFAVLTDLTGNTPPQPDFDIFSFGAEQGVDPAGQGLNFSNLGLRISFPKADPGRRSLAMIESEIAFNTSSSSPRETSLYRNFQLELLGLQSGDSTTTPDSLSYLTVATPYGLQGVAGGGWHGLRFKLNLGTPGALASKINLNSTLLLAWSDASGSRQGTAGYQAAAGIQLPGAGSGGDVFSLQSVLKLSIGVVQLFYNATQKSFLLLLNEIALKFLGLLKVPPNGATAFFLFGNPNADSSTGLGWYAIYNQEKAKAPPKAPLTLDARSGLPSGQPVFDPPTGPAGL
jgi:hypothetical protein